MKERGIADERKQSMGGLLSTWTNIGLLSHSTHKTNFNYISVCSSLGNKIEKSSLVTTCKIREKIIKLSVVILKERGFPYGSTVKIPPSMQEDRVLSLDGEDPLMEEMVTHSRILAWRIPQIEEPGGYSPQGRKESVVTEQLSRSIYRKLWFDSRKLFLKCKSPESG